MTSRRLNSIDRLTAKPALVALLAASARLAAFTALAAWLAVLVLNEIVAAIVYTLAAILALLFWSCPG